MIPALQQYPRFEKGSPSTEYQQIINFCVNYLEGMLVGLIHMDTPAEIEPQADVIKPLQQRLLSRERTVRHAFQFQIEKYFSDFKSISRSRLRVHYTGQFAIAGLSDHKTSRILDIIELLSDKQQITHKKQLQNTARRLKTLVHRSDDYYDDNPISPLNLCKAFLASIETLNLSTQKNRYLFLLLEHTLNDQLGNFYNQIDLGLYHLGIMVELTDPTLFIKPEEDDVTIDDLTVEPGEAPVAESDRSTVTSLQSHVDKVKEKQLKIEVCINDFNAETENGTVNFESIYAQLIKRLTPLVEKKQRHDIQKFSHFFTSLLNNTLLSTPLKTQLSRLARPLLELVLIDPFFFRSSAHPVNDFLQSIVDFELRFKHQGESLAILSQSIDSLLEISKPTLSDYQPLIESYNNFKSLEVIRLERIKEEEIQREEKLKNEILHIINDITADLVVDQETMQFFYDDWQLLLLHVAHKLSKVSAEFKNSVNVAKMLSWFLNHNKTGFHPRFQSTSFKTLLTSIEIGLVTLNFSSEHRHRIRKQLVKEYKKANEKQTFSIVPASRNNTSPNKLKLAHNGKRNTGINSTQLAKNLNMGDWVEIKTSINADFTRAKLKWKATDYSLFIFIDQRGHKIQECDLTALNQLFSNGSIKLLKKPSFQRNIYF